MKSTLTLLIVFTVLVAFGNERKVLFNAELGFGGSMPHMIKPDQGVLIGTYDINAHKNTKVIGDFGWSLGINANIKLRKNSLELVTGLSHETFSYRVITPRRDWNTHELLLFESKNTRNTFFIPLQLKYNFGNTKNFFLNQV